MKVKVCRLCYEGRGIYIPATAEHFLTVHQLDVNKPIDTLDRACPACGATLEMRPTDGWTFFMGRGAVVCADCGAFITVEHADNCAVHVMTLEEVASLPDELRMGLQRTRKLYGK